MLHKYFIIENEGAVINGIYDILNDYTFLSSLGSNSDYNESMKIILKETPKLVFINVDRAIKEPFQFTSEINQFHKGIDFIAISCSKEKAYQAIKNDFFDFLLYPLTEVDILKIALKFKKKHYDQQKSNICLRSYKDYQYLNTNEILFLKADNNTTDFIMKDGTTITSYKTLKTFEKRLPNSFLRIHKSYIINRDYVSRINYGKLTCSIISYGYNIPFTKTYIGNVKLINEKLSESTCISLN